MSKYLLCRRRSCCSVAGFSAGAGSAIQHKRLVSSVQRRWVLAVYLKSASPAWECRPKLPSKLVHLDRRRFNPKGSWSPLAGRLSRFTRPTSLPCRLVGQAGIKNATSGNDRAGLSGLSSTHQSHRCPTSTNHRRPYKPISPSRSPSVDCTALKAAALPNQIIGRPPSAHNHD